MKLHSYFSLAIAPLLGILWPGTTLHAQAGNHVFTGAEATNFATIDLATPGGQTWSTDRAAAPGYFGAAGSATYTGAADNANVNGYIKYYAHGAPAAAFTFPVGTGADLRSLTLSGSIPATGIYAAAWIAGDPTTTTDPTAPSAGSHAIATTGTGIQAASPAGMWDWQDLSGDAAGLTITVSLPDLALFAAPGNLRLVGWNGTQWINLSAAQGAAAASGNAENSTLTGTIVSGITAIGIGRTSAPLPVTLASFDATAKGCTVTLNWTTVAEKGFSHFDIETSSDGKTYRQLGRIEAKGNSGGSYSYTTQATGNISHYRLRITDIDQSYTYSSVATVRSACIAANITAAPNPTAGLMQLSGIGTGDLVRIFDLSGRDIIHTTATAQSLSIDLRSYAAGLYQLTVFRAGALIFHQKIIKNQQ